MPKKERAKKTETAEARATNLQTAENHRRKAEAWLWFGVIVVSAVMILFWLISMKWQFSYITSKGDERRAIEQLQQNWNGTFTADKNEEEIKANAKKDIKAALDKIMAEEKNTSTTTNTIMIEPATTTTNTIKN